MSEKKKQREKALAAKQARQARRVINGIFIGLIILMVLFLVGYNLLFG